jgi:putative FmdB family regulatory protein
VPIYEYVCRGCGHHFEELVFGGRTPACPRCSVDDVERVLSVIAVGRSSSGDAAPAPAACGTCGDPRGPGSCARD